VLQERSDQPLLLLAALAGLHSRLLWKRREDAMRTIAAVLLIAACAFAASRSVLIEQFTNSG
jgi:hypothetical protein